MNGPDLRALRRCLDGAFPSLIATCDPEGTPNVSALSDACFVDDTHLALSFQFFNKTRANILANPRATLQLTDPDSGARYRVAARYLCTETDSALFARMKARLAGIASHAGMSKVFHLRGADVYEVLDIEHVSGPPPTPTDASRVLGALRTCTDALRACDELESLFDTAVSLLAAHLGFHHALVLLGTPVQRRLFTVASHGYPESGVGAEIAYGEGVIGVAAEHATPIRITHLASDYLYSAAVRDAYRATNPDLDLERRIPLPGLAESRSQLAMPLMDGARTVGVLYVERSQDSSIGADEEDALALFAGEVANRYAAILRDEAVDGMAPPSLAGGAADEPLDGAMIVAHDRADHSVFVDGEYLIKGVAGAILWRMLGERTRSGREEFTNRELRRDESLGLPDIADNLEARLVLLRRRLDERSTDLRLEKTGRGRHRLHVARPVRLEAL